MLREGGAQILRTIFKTKRNNKYGSYKGDDKVFSVGTVRVFVIVPNALYLSSEILTLSPTHEIGENIAKNMLGSYSL